MAIALPFRAIVDEREGEREGGKRESKAQSANTNKPAV